MKLKNKKLISIFLIFTIFTILIIPASTVFAETTGNENHTLDRESGNIDDDGIIGNGDNSSGIGSDIESALDGQTNNNNTGGTDGITNDNTSPTDPGVSSGDDNATTTPETNNTNNNSDDKDGIGLTGIIIAIIIAVVIIAIIIALIPKKNHKQ